MSCADWGFCNFNRRKSLAEIGYAKQFLFDGIDAGEENSLNGQGDAKVSDGGRGRSSEESPFFKSGRSFDVGGAAPNGG
jgi:hypothetical protein